MRGEFRQENQLTAALRLPLRGLPDDVLERWLTEMQGDVEVAFKALIVGSAHICDKCHCERPNANALRLYFELAGKIGPTQTLIVNILGNLGATDLDDAARLISRGKEMLRLEQEGVSDEQAIEDAADILAVLLRKHPEKRLQVLGKLGGLVETNGNKP